MKLAAHTKYFEVCVIAFAIVMSACGTNITPPSTSIENIHVDTVAPVEDRVATESFPLPNCGGNSELSQTLGSSASIQKSVTIGATASAEGSGEVAIPATAKLQLKVAVEAAYQQTFEAANSRLDTITMKAAAHTFVTYDVGWYQQTFSSIVEYSQNNQVYQTPYAYQLRVPKLDNSHETPCNDSSGGNTISTPQPTESSAPIQQFVGTGTIGNSVMGRSVDFTRIGNSPQIVVIAGALHGMERNAANLVEVLSGYIEQRKESLGNDFTFYFLPRLDPDGLAIDDRYNANGVDLNRNWSTSNWQPNTQDDRGTRIGGGGSKPFSEPETTVFSEFLLNLDRQNQEPLIVFIYHSTFPGGLVQPSYRLENGSQTSDPGSEALAREFADQVGYEFSRTWLGNYSITGEAIHWCGEQRILCMDIELDSSDNLSSAEAQEQLDAILHVLQK